MYHFIQRHLELSDDILVKAKYWLAKYSEMADIQLFIQHLFPIELDIDKEDIKTDIYRDNYTIFFYDLPKFIKVYYKYNELTEAELLWFISNAPEMLVHFERSIYLKRGHLTILRRFHNVNVLYLWLNNFGMDNYIKEKWLAKYPLFTLLLLLRNTDKERITDLIRDYLNENLLVLKPLQELLQGSNKTDDLNTLQKIIRGFTTDEIKASEIAFADLFEDKKALKKTNSVSKKLKWLTLPLQRFEHTDTCNPKYLGKKASFGLSEWGRETFDIFYKYDWCDFSSTIVDMYERTKDIDKSEHQILQANFDKLSLQQRYLSMFVKASVIVAHYENMLTGEYKLTANDYIHLDLTNHIGLKTFSPEDLIALTLSKTDEQHDKILFQANFPFNDYIGTREQTKSVIPLLEAYVRVCGDAGIAKALDVMGKIHNQRLEFLYIAKAIDSPVIVPHLLKNMHYSIDDYMKKHLTTVIDEVVYLSFTKQTDSLLKKAKTNAKKLFNDLAINHRKELIKSLKEYDKQLDKPVLIEFLNNYIEFYDLKDKNEILAEQQQQAEQIEEKTNVIQDDGIPSVLLDNDWQKLVNRTRINLPSYAKDLPPLIIKSTGQPLPDEAFQRLLKMLIVSEFQNPLPILATVLASFTHKSQTALADALWAGRASYDNSANSWEVTASSILYDEHIGDKAIEIMKNNTNGIMRRGKHLKHGLQTIIEVLAESAIVHNTPENIKASKNALRGLVYMYHNSCNTLNKPVLKEIKRYAKQAKVKPDAVPDLVLPDLGLDKQGKRVFTANGRSVTLRFDINLQPVFTDENGNKTKTLPSAIQTDEIKEQWLEIQKMLNDYRQTDHKILEHSMIHQRRISVADFTKNYLENPFLLRIAGQFIWAVYADAKTEESQGAFCVVETGECLDKDDEPVEFDKKTMIGIAHPIHLTDEELLHFRKHIADEEILQPFDQLERPFYRLTEQEQADGYMRRYCGVAFTTASVRDMQNNGWELKASYGGLGMHYEKYFQTRKRRLDFDKDPEAWSSVSYFLDDDDNDEGRMFERLNIKKLGKVEISEIIAELESLERVEK